MKSISGSHDLYLGERVARNPKVYHDNCPCGQLKRKEHDLCQSCGARRGILRRRARAVFRKIMKQKKPVRFYFPDDVAVGKLPDYHDDMWWEERLLMLSMLERNR